MQRFTCGHARGPGVFVRLAAAVLGSCLGGSLADVAHGQTTYYYSGGTKTWATNSSWWLNYAGTQAAGAAPGAADTAVFNASGANDAGVAVFNADRSVNGLQVLATATGAITLRSTGTNRTLTLGGGGIRVSNTNTIGLTLGGTSSNQGLNVILGASQPWEIGARQLTVFNQVAGSAGNGTSQTLLVVSNNTGAATAASAIIANTAVFTDGTASGRLNLWFDTLGRIRLSSSNTLTGTLTLQSTGVPVSYLETGGTTGNSLRTLSAVQLAGGLIAAGTASPVALSGSSTVRVLGGASLLNGVVEGAGALQRSAGGGFLGSAGGVTVSYLRGITNAPDILVNGVLPWGFVGDSSGGFATVSSGSLVTASLTGTNNLNSISGTTGNWDLNSQATQTLTKNITPNALQISTGTLSGPPAVNLGSFTLEANAIFFKSDPDFAGAISTFTATGGGNLKIGSSGELVISARKAQVTLAAPITGTGWLTLGQMASGGGAIATGGGAIQNGFFTLSGSNSHDGGTSIVSRGLNLNNAYALGSGTFRIGGNAIVLDNTSGGAITIATNNRNEWNSDFSFGGTQPLNLGTGTVSLGAWAGSWRTITTNGTAALTVGGPIVDGSYAELPTTGLVKSGSGVLVLAGNNAYTGGTEFDEGFLSVTSDANLGASSAPLIFNGGALRIAGTSFASLGGSRSVSTLVDQAFWFDVAEASHTFTVGQSLAQQGVGGLTKTGAGVLALTGTSTFTAAPAINEGVVSVATLAPSGQASPLGAGSQVNLGSASTSGTLRYTGAGTGTFGRIANLVGSGAIDAAGGGALTVTGTVSLGTGEKIFTLTGTSTALNTIGLISGTGPSVVKDGTGLWRMNAGSKAFNGTVTVKNGTLQVANAAAVGSPVAIGDTAVGASGIAALLLEQGVNTTMSVDVGASAGTQAVLIGGANTSGTATFSSGNVRMSRDVTLVAADGGVVRFENRWAGVTNNDPATQNVTIGAAGYAGRVVLDSSGTFATSGSVSIRHGTASVGLTTTVSSTGTLTTDAGATLAGTGFVTNAIGGAGLVSPGNSPGIFTAGSLNPSAGTDFIFEITGAAPDFTNRDASVNDVLRLTDATSPFASNLNAGNVVNVLFKLSGTSPVDFGTYKAGFFTDRNVDFSASIASGSFAYWVYGSYGSEGDRQQFAVGTDGALVTYSRLGAFSPTLSVQRSVVPQTDGVVNGQITQFTVVVPEPAAFLLAGVGMTLAAWRIMRRRRAG